MISNCVIAKNLEVVSPQVQSNHHDPEFNANDNSPTRGDCTSSLASEKYSPAAIANSDEENKKGYPGEEFIPIYKQCKKYYQQRESNYVMEQSILKAEAAALKMVSI